MHKAKIKAVLYNSPPDNFLTSFSNISSNFKGLVTSLTNYGCVKRFPNLVKSKSLTEPSNFGAINYGL